VGGDPLNFSKELLLAESESTGFRPEILEKVFHLIGLLNGFNSHPFLKDRVALKGGTAVNLFIFDLPRLSVDIDVNYIGSADREIMLSERSKIEKAVRAVCGREGFTVRRVTSGHAAITFFLRYESVLGQGRDLKVDLNFMLRVPLWPVFKVDSRRIGPYEAKVFPVLDVHELTGGKLAALLARRASRDLFDAHALLTGSGLDTRRLRLAFVVYGAINRKDWRSVQVSDVDFTEDEMRKELIPLLRKDSQELESTTRWAKRLVEETRTALKSLFPFTESEKEFLDRLLGYGEIEPLLLTEDEGLAARIRHHPGLERKALNVREFKRG
jgi:predicted nucleotidyltransferase component of viral defense system